MDLLILGLTKKKYFFQPISSTQNLENGYRNSSRCNRYYRYYTMYISIEHRGTNNDVSILRAMVTVVAALYLVQRVGPGASVLTNYEWLLNKCWWFRLPEF